MDNSYSITAIETRKIIEAIYSEARTSISKNCDFKQTVKFDITYTCRIVDGKIDAESLHDLVSTIFSKNLNDKWIFIPLQDLGLKFGDDPTCDARACWYLTNREHYRDFTGCFRLRHGHVQINICDQCYNRGGYKIELLYQTIVNQYVLDIIEEIKREGWHLPNFHQCRFE
jgi:hypothetical protein